MAGRPIKVEHVRQEFLYAVTSAEALIDSVRALEGIRPLAGNPRLHPKHVRRTVELAFLGLVASWDEFLEQTFVRYAAGAKCNGGYSPKLRLGAASDIDHAYHVISGDPNYNPETGYLKFSDPRWVIDSAKLYFDAGRPYSTTMVPKQDRLKEAAKLRNRVAHASIKCRTEFKTVAVSYLASSNGGLSQGYRVGDLLLAPAVRHFGQSAHNGTFFKAFAEMYRALAQSIVP